MSASRTPASASPEDLIACMECGLVTRLPELSENQRAHCPRCGSMMADPTRGVWSNRLCAASALGALVLYVPAITLPILTIERMGHQNVSSVWKGVVQFLSGGDYFVGLVVLICSVIIPVLKLLGLLFLVWGPKDWRPHARARLFRMIEWSGKWGMLDVLLIAILVAWVKMGDLVSIRPGKAVVAFCLMVFLSLVSSAYFDAKAIWRPTSSRQPDPRAHAK